MNMKLSYKLLLVLTWKACKSFQWNL